MLEGNIPTRLSPGNQGWTELIWTPGQREGPSRPQVQLAPGPWHRAGGTRRVAVAAGGAGLFPNVPSGNAPSRTQVTLSRPEPLSSFEAGEGGTFPVDLTSAVSGTLRYPSHSSSTFLPLEVSASGRALLGKALKLRVCATSVQHCKW